MTELLTSAQMRAIEQSAIASGEVMGLELMERAGKGVVEAIFEEWPEMRATSHRAVVLCGPGNNGGDGFVIARLLKLWGWEVTVFFYGTPEGLPPDARANHDRWLGLGQVLTVPSPQEGYDPWGLELIVDALFGTGLSRPIDLETGLGLLLPEWDLALEPGRPRIVAVDVPSGLCADSGRQLAKRGFWADLTVTFQRAKAGHYLAQGPSACGKLRTMSIGLDDTLRRIPCMAKKPTALVRATVTRALSKSDPYGRDRHKYSHGHALILSGPTGRGGAARLAARGSLRVGAGVVTVGCPPEAIPENAARLDAVMLRGLADGVALAWMLEDKRINALCLGPGMGTGDREAGLVAVALGLPAGGPPPSVHEGERHRARSVVLDADALTLLSEQPDLFAALHERCVLTPHAGEFARLFPDIAANLATPATKGPAYSKVHACREAAARAGCVVLFKGPDTVIADASGRCAINSAVYDRAAPWLATAGSGDVLAGFITGLLARGFCPFDAACTGAWLHVECALSFGPGLIAEDLPEELPKVLRALGI